MCKYLHMHSCAYVVLNECMVSMFSKALTHTFLDVYMYAQMLHCTACCLFGQRSMCLGQEDFLPLNSHKAGASVEAQSNSHLGIWLLKVYMHADARL